MSKLQEKGEMTLKKFFFFFKFSKGYFNNLVPSWSAHQDPL